MALPQLSPRLLYLVPLAWLAAALAGSGFEIRSSEFQTQSGDGDKPWEEILAEPQGEWPFLRQHETFADLGRASVVAARENRPIFVVMYCPTSQGNADFDSKLKSPAGELASVLPRFVNVRLPMIHGVDLHRLPVADFQDLDSTWWAWFLSPEGRVYGVYGAYGGLLDQSRPSATSVEALTLAMKRVLDHHYDPRRPEWDVDGTAPEVGREVLTPYGLPGWPVWSREFVDANNPRCLRCHEVSQVLRQPRIDEGHFDKRREFEIWPFLKNIGIEVEEDNCLFVSFVDSDSPAGKVGIRAGDVLGAAGGRRLFSRTDLRGVLHRLPRDIRHVSVHWTRDGEVLSAELELPDHWRRTQVAWRSSLAWGNIGAHPGFDIPGALNRRARARLGIPDNKMAVRPLFTKAEMTYAQRAGLLPSHIIVAVNGRTFNVSGRAFMAWFRLKYNPGDPISLMVRKGPDQPIEHIEYKARAFPRQ